MRLGCWFRRCGDFFSLLDRLPPEPVLLVDEHELADSKNNRYSSEANGKTVEGVPPDRELLIGAVSCVDVDSNTVLVGVFSQIDEFLSEFLVVQGLVFGGSGDGARGNEEDGGNDTDHDSENAQGNLFECTWTAKANPVE